MLRQIFAQKNNSIIYFDRIRSLNTVCRLFQFVYSFMQNRLPFALFSVDGRSDHPESLYTQSLCSPIMQFPLAKTSISFLIVAVIIRRAAFAPHSHVYFWLMHPSIVFLSLITYIKKCSKQNWKLLSLYCGCRCQRARRCEQTKRSLN